MSDELKYEDLQNLLFSMYHISGVEQSHNAQDKILSAFSALEAELAANKEKLSMIFDAWKAVQSHEITELAFILVVANIIDPAKMTEADFEWAQKTAKELGYSSEGDHE